MIRFYKLFLITLFTLYFSCSQSVALTYKEIHPNHTSFDYEGRFLKTNVSEYAFEWPGTCIKTSFTGHYLAIKLGHEAYNQNPQENTAFFNVFIDDSLVSVLQVSGKLRYFEIKLPFKNKLHELKIYKRTEAIIGTSYFGGIKVEAKSKVLKLKKQATYKFQFIGNSITCGYGVLGTDKSCHFSGETESNYDTYAAITARSFNAASEYIAYSGKGLQRNYNYDTSATIPDLYSYVLPVRHEQKGDTNQIEDTDYKPDAFFILLGTNDFSHSNPDSLLWVSLYTKFVKKLKVISPKAHVFCLVSPMMSDYWPKGQKSRTTISNYIQAAQKKLTQEHQIENVHYFELSIQGKLGYGCDWHPSVLQQRYNATELVSFVKSKLE